MQVEAKCSRIRKELDETKSTTQQQVISAGELQSKLLPEIYKHDTIDVDKLHLTWGSLISHPVALETEAIQTLLSWRLASIQCSHSDKRRVLRAVRISIWISLANRLALSSLGMLSGKSKIGGIIRSRLAWPAQAKCYFCWLKLPQLAGINERIALISKRQEERLAETESELVRVLSSFRKAQSLALRSMRRRKRTAVLRNAFEAMKWCSLPQPKRQTCKTHIRNVWQAYKKKPACIPACTVWKAHHVKIWADYLQCSFLAL